MTIFRQTNKQTVVIQFQSIENLTSVPWMSKFRDFVLYFDVLYRFFTGREIHAVFPARANVCVFSPAIFRCIQNKQMNSLLLISNSKRLFMYK